MCPRLQNAVKTVQNQDFRLERFEKALTRQMLITTKDLRKLLKRVEKTPFRDLPTSPKCCKKQYKIKIFVLGDQKKHSCARC